MKPRLAAVLSIAGVLTAGSAAALVNTRVLEGQGTNDTAIAAAPPTGGPTTSIALPTTSGPDPTVGTTVTTTVPGTSGPSGTAPSSSAPDASAPAAPPAPEAGVGVYQLGDGGRVTLSTAGGVLSIVSVDPVAGWEVHEAENDGSHRVEIRLRTDDREVRFEASLVFGVVSTSLETDDD
jgi:hypothetical protein